MKRTYESDDIVSFVEAAKAYCRLIEERESYTLASFIEACTPLLATLYLRATTLPDIEDLSDDKVSGPITTDEWKVLFKNLSEYLGKYNMYSDVFDPVLVDEAEVTSGSLADDLADIYRDLKNGFLIIEQENGNTIGDVIWEWKFSFGTHWGVHLTGALRVLHSLRYSHLNEDYL